MDGTNIDDLVSLLPELKEFAATSIVINLAYLNLDRFRYRKWIGDHARQEINKLNGDGTRLPDNYTSTLQYKRIERLARFSSSENVNPATRANVPTGVKLPPGLWSKIYITIFERHQDRTIVTFAACIAFALLYLGSANAIGYCSRVSPYFAKGNAILALYVLLATIMIPVAFVLSSRFVVLWASKLISETTGDIEKMLQQLARNAKLQE